MSPALPGTTQCPLASQEDSDHHDYSGLGRLATATASSWDLDQLDHWQLEPFGDSVDTELFSSCHWQPESTTATTVPLARVVLQQTV